MKNIIACLTVLVGLFAFVVPGLAAETWVPTFSPTQKVYVDPLMQQRVALEPGFTQKLEQIGQDKGLGLDVYVVIAQRGDEFANVHPADWAGLLTNNRLLTAWRYAPGYQEKNVELIVYLRDANSDAGSIFVHSGTDLLGYGIDENTLSAANGPVLPAARAYMRTNPTTGILTIQSNVVQTALSNIANSFLGISFGAWLVIIILVALVLLVLFAAARSGGGFFIVGGGSSCSSCSSGSGDGGGGDC